MWITHAWIQTYLKTESYECQCHIIDVGIFCNEIFVIRQRCEGAMIRI